LEWLVITLYTDASYDNESKIGGWAIWAVFNGGKKQWRGRCVCQGSATAEAIAVAAGIRTLSKMMPLDEVVICSDWKGIGRMVKDGAKYDGPTRQELAIIHNYLRFVQKKGVFLRAKKVTAHRKDDGRPSWYLNNWCDQNATQARLKGNAKVVKPAHFDYKNKHAYISVSEKFSDYVEEVA
jgi:ribonuclease HI